jgi:hypothetical protein
MRRPALVPALALALALASGCSDSPCQELGEKLCVCTGAGDACETQVKSQLDGLDLTQGRCEDVLQTCNAPEGADFCEWLLTEDGKRGCEIAPPP